MNYIGKYNYFYEPYIDITVSGTTNALINTVPYFDDFKQPLVGGAYEIKKGSSYLENFKNIQKWDSAETYQIEEYSGVSGGVGPFLYYYVLYETVGNYKVPVNNIFVNKYGFPVFDKLKIQEAETLINLDLTPQEIVV